MGECGIGVDLEELGKKMKMLKVKCLTFSNN